MTMADAVGGAVLVDRLGQRALGDELHDRVDGEDDVVAVDRPVRSFAADEVHAAPRVAQQRHASGAAAHLRVERVLDAAEPFAVESDVADDVRGEHARADTSGDALRGSRCRAA